MRSNRADKWHSLHQVYSGCLFTPFSRAKSLNFLKKTKKLKTEKHYNKRFFRAKKASTYIDGINEV